MGRHGSTPRFVRVALLVLAAAVVVYLAVIALYPGLREGLPPPWNRFGAPASWQTVAIAVGLITAVCALTYRARRSRESTGAPIAIVVGLLATAAVLGIASYLKCTGGKYSHFFAPLAWTASMLRGGVDERSVDGVACPALPPPVALEVARLAVIAAILVGVVGVVVRLFQAQVDRIRVGFAKSVTAVVGVDDDSQSMVSAVAKTLDRRSELVLLTSSPDRPCVSECRREGARVIMFDDNRPETLTSNDLWRHLDRLYLLSPDAATNLLRLAVISERLSAIGKRQRLPLIVRIDDPWQAEAWRSQQFGGSDTRWAADAVGKYEVTARRLLDRVVTDDRVRRILVCGTSQLTLALCADMAQRQAERAYYTDPQQHELPAITLLGEKAEEYRDDHQFRQEQLGVTNPPTIDVICEPPSVPVLTPLITGEEAVIFADTRPAAVDVTAGTRLAARFPATPIFMWDPDAQISDDRPPIVGQLRTYRLAMDMWAGQAQDTWERAAMLIHERYAAEVGHKSPASQPWAQLDEFYRGSNRRQVSNALWMVEMIAGHTWNTWGSHAPPPPADIGRREPLEQLRVLGYDGDAAMAMAQAEFEDWSRYYRSAGWRYGPVRDDARKIHNKLVDWPTTAGNPELARAALSSLATTLLSLRELGYASRPVWQKYRRAGTVTAVQRDEPWMWTSHGGDTMQAGAGDWEVRDSAGDSWSVRDDKFHSTYQLVAENRYERKGFVRARPARESEIVDTLEGPVTTAPGDWVVEGSGGEQWPVPGDEFAQRYVGPVSMEDEHQTV